MVPRVEAARESVLLRGLCRIDGGLGIISASEEDELARERPWL